MMASQNTGRPDLYGDQHHSNRTTGKSSGRKRYAVAGLGGALVGATALTLSLISPAAATGISSSDGAAANTKGINKSDMSNASHPVTGTVHANGGLVRRAKPTVHTPAFGKVANRSTVKIDCQINGTAVMGNRQWYQLAAYGILDGWVSGEYVSVNGGKQVRSCTPGTSTSATTTKATTGRQGPSRKDRRTGKIKKGAGIEVWCYTETHDPRPGRAKRWLATLESGWIPAAAVKADKHVPYCQG